MRTEATEFGEVTKIRAITPVKVIQGHRFWYQSKLIHDFLLVILTYLLSCTVSEI